jgi:hypothetical protein
MEFSSEDILFLNYNIPQEYQIQLYFTANFLKMNFLKKDHYHYRLMMNPKLYFDLNPGVIFKKYPHYVKSIDFMHQNFISFQ